MTSILFTTGVITLILVTLGAAVLMAAVALTDIHERVKQWVMHRVWW